ncbi:hypothetical protein E2C01_075616 [Portunus trituberculatus]|uniref:Uncharacterized protein n=1 Tax=Portunus trituberculatus TaxID=210409 RepID=A0A5B7IG90_PORTR|nr:hypothetical protein [Portunus trituberculatus]
MDHEYQLSNGGAWHRAMQQPRAVGANVGTGSDTPSFSPPCGGVGQPCVPTAVRGHKRCHAVCSVLIAAAQPWASGEACKGQQYKGGRGVSNVPRHLSSVRRGLLALGHYQGRVLLTRKH